MGKEEYLEELNKAFGNFKFFEEDHHYEYKGQRVGISVTRLIEDYTNEFDADTIAEKVALKENKSVQDVLDEWKTKNLISALIAFLSHLRHFLYHLVYLYYSTSFVRINALNDLFHTILNF